MCPALVDGVPCLLSSAGSPPTWHFWRRLFPAAEEAQQIAYERAMAGAGLNTIRKMSYQQQCMQLGLGAVPDLAAGPGPCDEIAHERAFLAAAQN